ncbi:MAG: glycosyltransferase family 1 protein [Nitrospirae bacterium]|nr:MAG: glycosyltransferase family 1 protein [Nitrospirota bacterium]
MRIAFVKKKFSVHGGAERYLETLIAAFKKNGHEIHIFANNWTDTQDVIFHKVPVVSFNSYLSVASFNRNVCGMIKSGWRNDCVISLERTACQDIYRAGEGCHAEWLEIRSRYEPALKRASFKLNPLHRAMLDIEKKLFQNTPLIVANSNMVKRHIIKHYGVEEARITVIYNGVDLERFSFQNRDGLRNGLRKDLSMSEDAKIILFVGTGFERKGLKTLIEACSLLKEKNARLIVVGKGKIQKYAKQAADSGIGERAIFLDAQKDIERFYAAADLFVLPTLYDPFSNATLEAMASGLAVITTRNNGAAELVAAGQNGFVTEALGDATELAGKMDAALRNSVEMGKAARATAESYPVENAVKGFYGLINKVGESKDR